MPHFESVRGTFLRLQTNNLLLYLLITILADYRMCFYCLYPVHGFENTSVTVDEGDLQMAIAIRLDIKGNTTNERLPVTGITFIVTCTDITTGKR